MINLTHEEKRKVPIKFIVHSEGWFMCSTNWSKTYSAGVIEYTNEEDARKAGDIRVAQEPRQHYVEIYGYNEFGERIK